MLTINQDDDLFIGDSILQEFGKCTDCGLCCRFFDSLPIYPDEIENISAKLSISKEQFKQGYTKQDKEGEISLKTPCPFQSENHCQIYPHRFFTCRTFPLCINLTQNQGIISGIYLCPQATQFYEGMLAYYHKHHPKTYQHLVHLEEKTTIDEKGMKITGPASLFSPYLDWLISKEK